METTEHTELGNALPIANLSNNPYLRMDELGIMHIRLQRFDENKLPIPMGLELSVGEIIAMAGDFFTDANWTVDLELPKCGLFQNPTKLGKHLINTPIRPKEEDALIKAYNNLAAPDVTRKEIDRIYTITNAEYLPFSETLNFYAKQLMFYFRVKNYGEMITRNQTHFTPWSIRVYVLGHTIALRYAHLAYELRQTADSAFYQSKNPDFLSIKQLHNDKNEALTSSKLRDLADRYEALAFCMEFFTFHYYSDHFATGHMSMIGDLRVVLKERFGMWGNILANNLHDEVNRVGVYTINPYSENQKPTQPPTRSRGDGKVDSCLNKFNRLGCLTGMTASLNDVQSVLKGGELPQQKHYAGLSHLPDVDYNSRQHQPLLVFSKGKVYYRKELSNIKIVSPVEYEALRDNPKSHGYSELKNSWDAFVLVCKLRLLPCVYTGAIKPIDDTRLKEILADEKTRNPEREPIQPPGCPFENEATVFSWKSPRAVRPNKDLLDSMDGLKKFSLLKSKTHAASGENMENENTVKLGI
ncbi:hypothetical protein [Legionella waltersii]|uniref:Dot/Icm secretion system substrate n=1 Tax=Legionella waltersii TaxID=66969 RepID=A0A0W1A589_9GAMM|nr:hypothetical protein [Legionella waltersii]KTD76501.1 Dot/Icm secretion system substrate [Legionella waltersii]SNU93768.1 Dot/Icm T4SS effector [Legionella waltersii]